MKIVTASSGKKSIKISRSEWIRLGKHAGWYKKSAEDPEKVKDDFTNAITYIGMLKNELEKGGIGDLYLKIDEIQKMISNLKNSYEVKESDILSKEKEPVEKPSVRRIFQKLPKRF